MSNDAFTIPWFPVEKLPDRSMSENQSKADSAMNNIFGYPNNPEWKPEGVEGEDYYQDVSGNYFAWHDDLGTQALTEPSGMDASFLNRETGTGDAYPQNALLPRAEPFHPERPANPNWLGSSERQHDTRLDSSIPEYARTQEGTEMGESLFQHLQGMDMLSDSMDAIDAKYEGSKTDASAEAELKEILNATLAAFGSDAGRENAALAREQQDMRQANATSYIPEYAREDEGTDTGELAPRDLVRPSLVYTGSGRATGGEAREGQKSGRGPGLATSIHNQAILDSIFKEPEPIISSSPSLFIPQQIKPNVAETKNNMTVPKINWGGSGYGNNPGPWRW